MTDPTPIPPKSKSSRRVWGYVTLVIFLFFLCMIPEVVVELVMGIGYLAGLFLLGWVGFLRRVSTEIKFDTRGIVVAIGAFVLLVFGIQAVVTRIFSKRTWTQPQIIRSVVCIMGILLGGICLIGLGHEFSWSQRSKTRWMRIDNSWDHYRWNAESKNKLKQLGVAVWTYESAHHSFPVGGQFYADGTAGHSWMTALLPHIGQAKLHDQIHFDVPWYHPKNRDVFRTQVPDFQYKVYGEMDAPVGDYAFAFFAANARLINANRSYKAKDITDGTSNTVLAGTVRDNLRPWGDVANWRSIELGINKSPHGFGSPFKTRGALFLLADGSVRQVSENVDPNILKALATPDAGDVVGDY